ncbi:endonuclease/exonuclease/phosphatase family protein [Streptomyces sp. C11-1]|uniref:Endonuclease/exonuclease/phosphatase family protein n=1 Tax=Streptomyces durocortorensis TaxID=2811104 RepID=A0ABY9W2Q8_9ACTN|nr:endonuclease/exonuclease/phosphatase family protein [Streptomyces durocortorensis]WNF29497.1 endonuclease/exonuclease/phosphatase family protein [Streptomyces durocortorensis]
MTAGSTPPAHAVDPGDTAPAGAVGGDRTAGAARAAVAGEDPGRPRRIARLLRLWYGRLVLAVAALWLLYAVTRVLLSDRWHWSLVLDAVPPLLLLGVPAALLVAAAGACGRRRPLAAGTAALALALALTTGSGLNWPALWRDPGPVPRGALRVVSLNTQYWGKAAGTDRLRAFLGEHPADVYLLQEHVAWTPGLGEEGYARLDDDEALRRQFPGYHIARRGELLTVSRFPVLSQTSVGVPPATDGKDDFGREFLREKVLRTDLAVGDRVLSTYNVHITVPMALDNLNPFSEFDHDAYFRRKDAWRREELRGLERDVAANPHPSVIAGDFNTTAASRALDGLRATATDATPVSGEFLPLSWKYASPGEFSLGGVLDRPLPFFRLDWAFTAGGAEAHRYEFVPTDGLSEHRMQDLWISF